jgi:tRNA/rRNA methyltransferase
VEDIIKNVEISAEVREALSHVRVVLKSPLYGGNVGSICRAMGNMGIHDLAIAAPRTLDLQEARMMACHASAHLDARTEYPDLAAAVADCGMVIGTTARGGLYRQHARTARDWAQEILKTVGDGTRVALVFGPEDNGLNNDDLALCTHIIQIPTTDEYSSLNLSQAVLICLYEIFVATDSFSPHSEKSEPAPSELRERMFSMWRELLLEVDFMSEDKADHMMLGFRRIMARGAFTYDDVNIMMGIARQSEWALGQPREAKTKAVDEVPA